MVMNSSNIPGTSCSLRLSEGLSAHESLPRFLAALPRGFAAVHGEGQADAEEGAVVDGDVTLQEGSPEEGRPVPWCQNHGSLDSIRYMVYNGYYKVMSNIPKMGHLTTPENGGLNMAFTSKNGDLELIYVH